MMKSPMTIRSLLILMSSVVAVFIVQPAAAEEFKVITNPSIGLKGVDQAILEKVFLAKVNRLNGKPIRVVLYRKHQVQQALARKLANKTENRFIIHWKRQVFAGKILMPRYVSDEVAMTEYVKRTPGAIGFVSQEYDTTGENVLVFEVK